MTKRTRREELLYMFDQRSAEKRCTIIKGLKEEGKVITAESDVQFRKLDGLRNEASNDIMKLRDKIAGLDQEIYDLNGQKAALLKEHKLYSFRNETCGTDTMHPELIAFDEEVRKERQDIIMMKLPR